MAGRLADSLVLNNQGYSEGRAPMLDLKYGGWGGFAPNLDEWVNQTHYVRQQLQQLLVSAPRGFSYLPDQQMLTQSLKSLVETHPKSIDGFKCDLTVESSETPATGGGEIFQDPTDVKKARSEPQFVWVDLYGRPIQNFLKFWINYLIKDPDSKVANLATISGANPGDLLADMYSMTMLFFEPDPTFTKVGKAWLTCNMWPQSAGPEEGKRDLTAAGETLELSIQFSALSSSTIGVRLLAQRILDTIVKTNANAQMAAAFASGVDTDVNSLSDVGLVSGITKLASTSINPRG